MSRVLVYTDGGLGASEACVSMTIRELRRALSWLTEKNGLAEGQTPSVEKTDAVSVVGGELETRCSLLVMPGGRDLPYCSRLNGPGNERIRNFVGKGGSYLGLCAGGYYGAARVEFSVGDPLIEVVGPRELNFYPGVARGPVFPGFRYDSNAGAQLCSISFSRYTGLFKKLTELPSLPVFYNGGCYFSEDRKVSEKTGGDLVTNVEVLATYDTPSVEHGSDDAQLDVQLPDGPAPYPDAPAAIVSMDYGRGRVVLSGVHIESGPEGLSDAYSGDHYIESLLNQLTVDENVRQSIFNALIEHLIQ